MVEKIVLSDEVWKHQKLNSVMLASPIVAWVLPESIMWYGWSLGYLLSFVGSYRLMSQAKRISASLPSSSSTLMALFFAMPAVFGSWIIAMLN